MKNITKLALTLSAAALLGTGGTAQAALFNVSLNFDGAGTTAGAYTPAGLTIGYGQYIPNLDSFGDTIPGSEHWALDLSGGPVPVINPFTVGWGAAPSGTQALDARGGPVLLVFDTPFNLASFTAKLDNSTFGDLAGTNVEFYNAANSLLSSIAINETIPGLDISAFNVGNVTTILLPSTAFYDNINIAAVPEPETVALFSVGLALIGWRRRRSVRGV